MAAQYRSTMIRVALEGSHWHSLYDAAYLRHLAAMPDVRLVGVQTARASPS